jgi:glycosyltransferase involved in cell wall biosynthesis
MAEAKTGRTSAQGGGLDVSIVMPCLNEVLSLGVCIAAAGEALAELERRHGLTGEIVIADNGSTDGSQALSTSLGARVVAVSERGYGAALRHGFAAARGRFLVMGDADGSYNFREAVAMVEALMAGADLCMGSRFKGGIAPGAMPWKNRYIGNPVLTGILNLLFRTGASDAHCGLRALTRGCFDRLGLTGAGMEFASEMVIKASLKGERIVEVPATLSKDLRDRPPHLRPWRDGWRHLRYLFMLSPTWLFAIPAAIGGTAALAVLSIGGWYALQGAAEETMFGNYWVILASALLALSHMAAILALAGRLYGIREGYRPAGRITSALSRWLSLETMLVSGGLSILAGLAILAAVVVSWSERDFQSTYSVFPAVLGALFLTLGGQNVFGGFILAIIGGNQAKFLEGGAADRLGSQPGARESYGRPPESRQIGRPAT